MRISDWSSDVCSSDLGGPTVGMACGVHGAKQLGEHAAAVRLVFALALFVLHHAALLIEHLLVDRAKQMAHAIGLHPQRGIERGGRHVLEIIGAIGTGGAVLVGDRKSTRLNSSP